MEEYHWKPRYWVEQAWLTIRKFQITMKLVGSCLLPKKCKHECSSWCLASTTVISMKTSCCLGSEHGLSYGIHCLLSFSFFTSTDSPNWGCSSAFARASCWGIAMRIILRRYAAFLKRNKKLHLVGASLCLNSVLSFHFVLRSLQLLHETNLPGIIAWPCVQPSFLCKVVHTTHFIARLVLQLKVWLFHACIKPSNSNSKRTNWICVVWNKGCLTITNFASIASAPPLCNLNVHDERPRPPLQGKVAYADLIKKAWNTTYNLRISKFYSHLYCFDHRSLRDILNWAHHQPSCPITFKCCGYRYSFSHLCILASKFSNCDLQGYEAYSSSIRILSRVLSCVATCKQNFLKCSLFVQCIFMNRLGIASIICCPKFWATNTLVLISNQIYPSSLIVHHLKQESIFFSWFSILDRYWCTEGSWNFLWWRSLSTISCSHYKSLTCFCKFYQ